MENKLDYNLAKERSIFSVSKLGLGIDEESWKEEIRVMKLHDKAGDFTGATARGFRASAIALASGGLDKVSERMLELFKEITGHDDSLLNESDVDGVIAMAEIFNEELRQNDYDLKLADRNIRRHLMGTCRFVDRLLEEIKVISEFFNFVNNEDCQSCSIHSMCVGVAGVPEGQTVPEWVESQFPSLVDRINELADQSGFDMDEMVSTSPFGKDLAELMSSSAEDPATTLLVRYSLMRSATCEGRLSLEISKQVYDLLDPLFNAIKIANDSIKKVSKIIEAAIPDQSSRNTHNMISGTKIVLGDERKN